MSVIITEMDMPKCCDVCERDCPENLKIWYLADDKDINNGTAIHPNCPLKSIDGLIDKIIERGDLYTIGGRASGKSVKLGMEIAIEIIKEYCGVSE